MRTRLLVPLLSAALALVAVGPPGSAAAAAPTVLGHADSARQNADLSVTTVGWTFAPAHPSASIRVLVYLDGRYAGTTLARYPNSRVDSTYKITGNHQYSVRIGWPRLAHTVTLRSADGAHALLSVRAITQVESPAARVLAVAKRYVGRRYVEGGTTPAGFDCSGYTQYVYAQSRMGTLARTAEQQRRMKGMRIIPAAQARPGDLIFYLSGSRAYHVAIFAGGTAAAFRGYQYAATTPGQGVKYQSIWSSSIQFGTILH